jgi:hypothetical protein
VRRPTPDNRRSAGLWLAALPRPEALAVRLEARGDRLWTDGTLATPVAADGDPVGAWRDTAGGTQLWAQNGTRRPAWRPSGMQGARSCVEFTQADADRMEPLSTVPTHSGARSLLVELELTTALAADQYCYVFGSGDGGLLWLYSGAAGQSFSYRSTGTGTTVGCGGLSGAGLPAANTRCLFGVTFDGVSPGATSSYAMRLNGASQSVVSSYSSSLTTWGIGSDPSLAFPYATPLRLRRLLVWNAALSPGEMAAAEAYCST